MDYTVSIMKSGEFYIAQCEQLPEALTQGSTIDEVLINAKDAIRLVLEAQKEQTRCLYKGQKVIRRKVLV